MNRPINRRIFLGMIVETDETSNRPGGAATLAQCHLLLLERKAKNNVYQVEEGRGEFRHAQAAIAKRDTSCWRYYAEREPPNYSAIALPARSDQTGGAASLPARRQFGGTGALYGLVKTYQPAKNQHGVSHWPVARIVLHELDTGLAEEP